MRVAMMGAGSLGIFIGGLLAESGLDIELIAASPASVQALRTRGAVIRGIFEKTVPVRACLPEEMRGEYDYVFLTTKLSANATALPQLLPHLHPGSCVCTLQNGMPEEDVAAVVGPGRTIGGVVIFGATRLEPGVSLVTTTQETLDRLAFQIGEIDGSRTWRLETVREMLSVVGKCSIVTDLMSLRWSKLLINTAIGGVCAALGCTCGRMLDTPDAVALVLRVADETIRTAHACGYRLTRMQDLDLEAFGHRDGDKIQAKADLLEHHFRPHAPTRPSMLQDLELGRKTEIDHLSGYVSRKGREVGVPTPGNDLIVKLIRQAEDSGGVPDFENGLALARLILI